MMTTNRRLFGQVLLVESFFRSTLMQSARPMAQVMIRRCSHLHGLTSCLFVALFFLLVGCEKSKVIDWNTVEMTLADDSNLPLILKEAYQRDSEALALSYLHKINGKYEGIEIPRHIVQTHYFALIHVFNAVDLAARDSVVTIYNIHTNGFPDTRELLLSVNPTADWVDSWRNGQQITGVTEIDSLMEKYDLQIIRITPYLHLQQEIAVLRSGRPLNIETLARCFEGISGINYAESITASLSLANNIYAYYRADHIQLDYKLEWFDLEMRYWTFDVYLDGRVEFVGSRGSTPP